VLNLHLTLVIRALVMPALVLGIDADTLLGLVSLNLRLVTILARNHNVLVETEVAAAVTHLTPTVVDARALTADIASLGSTTGLSLAVRPSPVVVANEDLIALLVGDVSILAHLVFLLPVLRPASTAVVVFLDVLMNGRLCCTVDDANHQSISDL